MALTRVTRAFWLKHLAWQQGEHVILIGQTGSGKTRLARVLLERRRYVVVLAVKKYDESLEHYRRTYPDASCYHLIRKWPPDYGEERVLFWPKAANLENIGPQREGIAHVLNSVYQSGGWAVYLDDMGYTSSVLRLERSLTVLMNQGRSAYISVVGSLTRPASETAHTPLEAFSQVRHVYLFRTQDHREHKRMAEIAGIPLKLLQESLAALGKYEFLAVDHGEVLHVSR